MCAQCDVINPMLGNSVFCLTLGWADLSQFCQLSQMSPGQRKTTALCWQPVSRVNTITVGNIISVLQLKPPHCPARQAAAAAAALPCFAGWLQAALLNIMTSLTRLNTEARPGYPCSYPPDTISLVVVLPCRHRTCGV